MSLISAGDTNRICPWRQAEGGNYGTTIRNFLGSSEKLAGR